MSKRKITIGTTYYENPEYLHRFIDVHFKHVDEMIIVDDGSSIYPIENYISQYPEIKFYRVLKDYGFNSHGCRNLIMKESSNDWNILLDLDRELVDFEQIINNIKNKNLNDNTIYKFYAHYGYLSNGTHKSVNDFLINKNFFFSVGGYDEELIGIRNGDRYFFEQLKRIGKEKYLHGCNLLLTRESSLKDRSIIRSPNDKNIIKNLEIIKERIKNPVSKKPILTFERERLQ